MRTVKLLDAVDASGNVTSISFDMGTQQGLAIEVSFSGSTLGGTLSVQCSVSGNNWATVPASSTTVASAQTVIYNFFSQNYRYIQIVWVPTTGTGTISALVKITEGSLD